MCYSAAWRAAMAHPSGWCGEFALGPAPSVLFDRTRSSSSPCRGDFNGPLSTLLHHLLRLLFTFATLPVPLPCQLFLSVAGTRLDCTSRLVSRQGGGMVSSRAAPVCVCIGNECKTDTGASFAHCTLRLGSCSSIRTLQRGRNTLSAHRSPSAAWHLLRRHFLAQTTLPTSKEARQGGGTEDR